MPPQKNEKKHALQEEEKEKEKDQIQGQPPQKKAKSEESPTGDASVGADDKDSSVLGISGSTALVDPNKTTSVNEDAKEIGGDANKPALTATTTTTTVVDEEHGADAMNAAKEATHKEEFVLEEVVNENDLKDGTTELDGKTQNAPKETTAPETAATPAPASADNKPTDSGNDVVSKKTDSTNIPAKNEVEKPITSAETSANVTNDKVKTEEIAAKISEEKESKTNIIPEAPTLDGSEEDERHDPAPTQKDFRGGQELWQNMLYELLLYKSRTGDFNIRHDNNEDKALYYWMQNQRKHYKLYKEGKPSFLNKDRIAVLDTLQFQWNIRGDGFWNKNYEAITEFKKEHGHTMVPRLWKSNPKLGEWVTDQRRQYKAKMEGKPSLLTNYRKAKLDDLGFVWRIRNRTDWSDRYEQLLKFKEEHGHTVVPQHYAPNKALGKWVAKQREQFRFQKEGKHSFLTTERIGMLDSIGFTWSIKGRSHKELTGQISTDGDNTEEKVGATLPMKIENENENNNNNDTAVKNEDERLPEIQQILESV